MAFRVPGLLTTNMFKPAVATIDVGINEIIGDVETDDFANIPSWTTPIPHDVGLAKIKMFMCKILIALEKANQYRADELIGLYQEKQMDA